MKSLRQLCLALVFTFTLALPVFAGEMQTTIAPPPALAGEIETPKTLATPTLAGEIQTGVAGQIDTMVNGGIETGLSLIQSLLALF